MFAQDIIKGKVTDDTGLELPLVSVVVKGTDKGTATDFDGKFELSIDDANSIITFSFICVPLQPKVIFTGKQY